MTDNKMKKSSQKRTTSNVNKNPITNKKDAIDKLLSSEKVSLLNKSKSYHNDDYKKNKEQRNSWIIKERFWDKLSRRIIIGITITISLILIIVFGAIYTAEKTNISCRCEACPERMGQEVSFWQKLDHRPTASFVIAFTIIFSCIIIILVSAFVIEGPFPPKRQIYGYNYECSTSGGSGCYWSGADIG